MAGNRLMKLWLASVLVLPLAGCVSRQLAPTVVSYNLEVEKAQNEVLLLNAVRAEKHLPMYLTDISTINGSISRSLTASLGLPFGHLLHGVDGGAPGVTANGTATPGATYTVNPTFTFNVLNTQDFYRGFLQPIDIPTVSYYLDQEYPLELLLDLFVLRVDVQYHHSGQTVTFLNHPHMPPNDNHDLQCFSKFVHWFAQDARFEKSEQTYDGTPKKDCEIPEKDKIGPLLDGKKLHLDDLLTAAGNTNLALIKVTGQDSPGQPCQPCQSGQPCPPGQPGEYQLVSNPPAEIQLVSGSPSLFEDSDCPGTVIPESMARTPSSRASSTGRMKGLAQGTRKGGSGGSDKAAITFHLRSPEGILYYLGQLLRLQHSAAGLVQSVCYQPGEEPLPVFVVIQRQASDGPLQQCESAIDATDADNDRYFIPKGTSPVAGTSCDYPAIPGKRPELVARLSRCDAGMSTTTLNIVAQLIGLQKAAKDFPSTGVVRAIVQ